MYLKKTELEQALRENMESTLENYGGETVKSRIAKNEALEKKLKQMIAGGTIR